VATTVEDADAGVMVLVVPTVLADLAVGATAQVVEHQVVLVAQTEALATVFNPFVKKVSYLFANSKELSIFADKYSTFHI
jgi:hypothetical protein